MSAAAGASAGAARPFLKLGLSEGFTYTYDPDAAAGSRVTSVSIDGEPHPLPAPFMVAATQNPVEYEGTYPLPEAQRDRFMARISMGYPSPQAELAMLDVHGGESPLSALAAVTDAVAAHSCGALLNFSGRTATQRDALWSTDQRTRLETIRRRHDPAGVLRPGDPTIVG